MLLSALPASAGVESAKSAAMDSSMVRRAPAAVESAIPGGVEIGEALSDSIDDISVTTLDSLEVVARTGKYSKRDNPAVALLREIRAARESTDPRLLPEYSEEFYTKTVYGINNCRPEDFRGRDRLKFIQDYADTAAHTGLPVMLLSLREKAGTYVHSLNFLKDKTIVKGQRSVGIDDELEQANVGKLLDDILAEGDIYSEQIPLMQHRFVSPLAAIGEDFYKYYLGDTVRVGNRRYVELEFVPRNAESMGFTGKLLVDADSPERFISRVEMRVPRYVNVNYVDNIYITQEYLQDIYGKRHKILDDMSLELTVIPNSPTLYARRVTRKSSPQFTLDHSLHNFLVDANSYIVYESANLQPWDKWNDFRMIPLSKAEGGMGSFMAKMRRYPAIYWTEKVLKILVTGYVATGRESKVDLGPINTLASYNSIEGWRVRVGGLTTAYLSPHWFGRGYVAYGFHDHKFKYNAELEYSFVGKEYHSHEFPINSLRLHYKYDLDQIGQHYTYTNSDNIFLSLKREKSYLALYRRQAGATYQIEWPNHFSIIGQFTHNIYESTPWLPFRDAHGGGTTSYIQAGFRLELRYAPGEKFYEGRSVRVPVNHDAPIVMLTQTWMPSGILGNKFCLNSTELSMSKRFWFSAFGCADVIMKFGKIWSQVQYPALMWQNANLSFTIQNESYSLMNPMEFPMDYFGSLDLTYFGNGILFNRIPLVNRLRLREVITFKGLMGGLTSKNDPARNDNLYRFPDNTATARLNSTPYMELGVGIDNILTCIRLDYIWRLTYRHVPAAPRSGLRVSLHFSF
ncbi:MAG: carboxypeptidase-like regulatory domain-containing protein [Muribaculaceae bacterium]|nr:carboxypeptidase-like regulatory domain-containing protein [Muribaculaceae bacterium]